MSIVNEEIYRQSNGKILDNVSYFYWNHIKQNAFWSSCIIIPAFIVFSYFAYDYIKGGFITRWEMSKISQVALFTIVPAGIFLNMILYYHAYNLILNSKKNFYTPYKLAKKFDSYFSKSIGFFFRVSGPFLLFYCLLYYTKQQFNPLIWSLVLIAAALLHEIACCTYGLRVVASVSNAYREPSNWNVQSSIAFFKSYKKPIILYAIISIISSVLFIGIWAVLADLSMIALLLYALFAGSYFVLFRATLHTKLLEMET